jgi:DNA-binding IclR family transcriptional regulator
MWQKQLTCSGKKCYNNFKYFGTLLHIVQQTPTEARMNNSQKAPLSFRGKKRSDTPIQTIQRAAAILRCFTENDSELGVTLLSEQLKLHKSTVSRLLSSLQREGFVEQNPETGKYRLGLGLVSLAGIILERMDLRRVAQPYLRALAESAQETINVTVLDGDECVNVERIASSKPIQYVGWLGRRTPTHCTSTGKVLLAFLTPQERDAILPETLLPYTEKTIVDRSTLEQVLAQVREQGYAIVHEEFEEGLSAVAAPIWGHTGHVIATVSIAGPTYRMGPGQIERFVEPLKETARKISTNLGYIAPDSDVGRV